MWSIVESILCGIFFHTILYALIFSLQPGIPVPGGVPNPFFPNGVPQAVQLSAANPFAQVGLFHLKHYSESC